MTVETLVLNFYEEFTPPERWENSYVEAMMDPLEKVVKSLDGSVHIDHRISWPTTDGKSKLVRVKIGYYIGEIYVSSQINMNVGGVGVKSTKLYFPTGEGGLEFDLESIKIPVDKSFDDVLASNFSDTCVQLFNGYREIYGTELMSVGTISPIEFQPYSLQ